MRTSQLYALSATASGTIRQSAVTVAIAAADSFRRHALEKLLRDDPSITVVGLGRGTDLNGVRVLLVDAPTHQQLSDWRARYYDIAIVALLDQSDDADAMAALSAGADAVLPRTATSAEIVAAIEAAAQGLAVMPRAVVALLREAVFADAFPARTEETPLTPRELEVLAAMADGASNKAIARRLGISFHTAKFHVAAILAKLDADTRTEAVTKAAQRGLVML
jgi:two-component system nitrate/nitrite response regulator NarL